MSIETRGSRTVYYRARWEDGRVVKKYVTSGVFAERAAAADEGERLEQRRRRQAERDVDAQFNLADTDLDQVDELLSKVLHGAGLHRPKRGRWRRRR